MGHSNQYGNYMQMKGGDEGWGYEAIGTTAPGHWAVFSIYIPDSGGVINSVCNHPGAAYIYNSIHDRFVECPGDGNCEHDWNFAGGSDAQKCDAAWYFSYADTE